MTDNELYHSGILGMRWGIRRFQRKDGSLTAEGKKRYSDGKTGSSSKGKPKATLTVTKPKVKTEAEKKAELEAKKKEILSSRSAKKIYENAGLFSDQELAAAFNRLTTEKNIKALIPAEVSKGERIANKFINGAGKLSEVIQTGTKLYNNIARVYNSVTDSGRKKPIPIVKDQAQNKDDGNKKDKK